MKLRGKVKMIIELHKDNPDIICVALQRHNPFTLHGKDRGQLKHWYRNYLKLFWNI